MREKSPQKDHLQQSVLIVSTMKREEEAAAADEEEREDNETVNGTMVDIDEHDGDWELLKATDAEAVIEIQRESSIASLLSIVDKVKTFAYSYSRGR